MGGVRARPLSSEKTVVNRASNTTGLTHTLTVDIIPGERYKGQRSPIEDADDSINCACIKKH